MKEILSGRICDLPTVDAGAHMLAGEKIKPIKQICKKLAKNKSIEEIADDLEEDVSTIEKIYNVAGEFAPEYDIDSIMEVLEKE